jgi:lipopolysaccharide export system protein LptA
MALVIADRVRETTTTTGTGTITLAGAVANFETFTANLSNSDTTYYSIVDNTNGAFEVGLGTFTSSGTTLARTTVIASSNSNSAVNFGSGTKDVFITIPATKIIVKDASGNVSIDGDVTVSDGTNDFDVASHDGTNGLKLGGTVVTSSAANLNILNGKTFVDEDDMSSNSATGIPSQQSVKAYVDSQVTAQDLDVASDSGTIDIDLDSESLTIAGGTGIASSASSTTVTLAVDAAQTGITSLLATDIKIGEDDETKIDFETANEIHFYADNASLVSLTNANSGDAVLTVPTADKNFTIAGTDGSSGITALDIDMALNGKATFSGDVVVTGDLTVTGDDIVMGTNTSGHIMVADGTNFNPVAVSGDISIASNGAVTIAGTSVETSMIAADAITGAKIADDAIDSEHYTDGSIDTAHIADSQVTTDKLASDAVTNAKIADDSIDSEHYVDGSIDTAHLASDAVTGAKIADDAIDSEHYTDGSIDTAHIGALQVTTGKIAADAITEAKIADDAVESEHINDNVISGQTELASGLASTDELLVSDAGTIKRMDMSVVTAFMTSEGFSKDDPTALAIALG